MYVRVTSSFDFQSSSLHPAMPFYIFGVAGVFGGLITLMVPETAGEKLPGARLDKLNY
jgi:hypothetical protein